MLTYLYTYKQNPIWEFLGFYIVHAESHMGVLREFSIGRQAQIWEDLRLCNAKNLKLALF